jgi:hypothetical protein
MKIIKIKDGKISIVNERGIALFPTFGKDVISAFYNDKQDLVVATLSNGKVELLSERGLIKKTVINSGAVNARFSGEDLIVETNKGKTEIRSQTGLLKRTI